MALKRISQPLTDLGSSEHLDNLTTTGVYHQALSRNTDVNNGYPEAQAGLLEVISPPGVQMVYQRYTVYNSRALYFRGFYGSSWGPWKKVLTE
ncbi:pyocin knob domain-containing protein [Corynebacterium sp. HMSC074C01]|uniref:pyocin knob domain-containing protein n=1 Tax=Corynebacterium sp. HMSC074C01 TaxID=1739482 RepID=UPI001FEE43AE|nr:pyocin knob domain-containing protein [Corynebacterium sp. HMSC074C01]